jgi:ABC-type sugar transport system ATPase subunit
MSGGQRQRVALGRALVRDPKVFLLDEPLSNLDAKLRTQMRAEITKLHKKIKTTFIYVTHDQVEAMTMGTRIVVMKDGFIQQIDTPLNLYNKPQNKFVAGFIGTPQMNFFDVKLTHKDENIILHCFNALSGGSAFKCHKSADRFPGMFEATGGFSLFKRKFCRCRENVSTAGKQRRKRICILQSGMFLLSHERYP